MPLPEGAETRHRFIATLAWRGDFGKLAVYVFDPYSIAISKIDRGFDTDLQDVLFLINNGLITFEQLEQYAQVTAPRLRGEKTSRDIPHRSKRISPTLGKGTAIVFTPMTTRYKPAIISVGMIKRVRFAHPWGENLRTCLPASPLKAPISPLERMTRPLFSDIIGS